MDKLDEQIDFYANLAVKLGMKHSVWSMYEIVDPFVPTDYDVVEKLVYNDHWGEIGTVEVELGNFRFYPTWIDLWRAADEAIKLSRDTHHVFIEELKYYPEEKAVYLCICTLAAK